MERRRRRQSSGRVHGEVRGKASSVFGEVWDWVRRIPRGRVMTYGQIATLLESRISPVAVGWAMHGCPEDVPWHRVVNASGGCSTDRLLPSGLQQALLRGERVVFRNDGTLDLSRYRWSPPAGRPRGTGGRSRA